MSVVFVALPASIALAALGLVAFIWAVRNGQMDDVDTPAQRMLLDDEVDQSE